MQELLNDQANRIERILAAQGLDVRVVGGTMGPRLTVFHAVKPASVKLAAVMRMDEEIALGLGAPACRIGRTGRHLTIEIPRRDPTTVRLLELVDRTPKRSGAAVVGVDEGDTPLMLSLDSPNVGHVLICGTTGSGKTALARAMIAGLAMSHAVFELGLVLVDPKRRGYVPFAGLPHLVHPVVHEPEEAAGLLAWAVEELERRDRAGVSSPRLVIFIDELADLMLVSSSRRRTEMPIAGEGVEASLTRLVQRGREAGIHVIACTQKPTTSVIGSLVKANFPARIVGRVTDTNDAYVASGISGTGAERLLGKGDFLVVAGGDVTRMQGAYISETEIRDLVTKLRGGRPFCAEEPGSGGAQEHSPPHLCTSAPLLGKRGRVLDFVARYQGRRNGSASADREPHNPSASPGPDQDSGHRKTPPTEAMIAFALEELKQRGEVSQRAVQRFHKDKYGTLCNTRRAQATIEVAQQRYRNRNGSSGGAAAGATASSSISEGK